MDSHAWLWLTGGCVVTAIACPLFVEWLRGRPDNLPRQTRHLVLYGLIGMLFFMVCGCFTVT